ncbi:MAG: hypothetical protein F6K19_14705 [Cyanothece sp. SIO1E1]|nr:hypothetical protein [Cyanothece sp. SIO1E1]
MKRFILGSLSVLLLATTATAARAESANTTNRIAARPAALTTLNQSPHQIVVLAYQGEFREQGIPAYASLSSAYGNGRITAQDLISAAIAQNRVDPSALNDGAFINTIDSELYLLEQR